jgi:hypothetical protein
MTDHGVLTSWRVLFTLPFSSFFPPYSLFLCVLCAPDIVSSFSYIKEMDENITGDLEGEPTCSPRTCALS